MEYRHGHPHGIGAPHPAREDGSRPAKAGRAFTDSPFDRWWVEYYRDVHGIDLDEIPVEENVPPPMVYEWNA